MPQNLAEQIDAELSKPWYSLRLRDLAELYRARSKKARWQDVRISSRIAGFVYIAFFITDTILIRNNTLYNIAAHLVIGLTFIFVIEKQIRAGVRPIYAEYQCALGIATAYSVWMWFASYSSHQIDSSYYLTYGIIFIICQNVFFNFRFGPAAISSTAMIIVFAVFLYKYLFQSTEYITAIGTLYLSTYAMTLFVNWKLNEERYRVFLNSLHAELRQKEATERGVALLRLSTTDSLTGLANRRAIDEELRTYWANWQNAAKSFAVILIDVDYFKRYNDQYGHQSGDRCLIAIAEAMVQATAKGQCALGRFGGEEFILLVRCQTPEHMALVAEAVRRTVEDLQIPHEQRPDPCFVVTVSIGAAFSRDIRGTKVERLITEADRALYEAKRSNRNCVKLFDREASQDTSFNDGVADLLRTATVNGLVSMVYQPIRDAHTGTIIAAEALMRLTSPSGKCISPVVFIPIAERMGTIIELGQWAIRTACSELIADGRIPLVSVNVSAIQLRTPGFALSVAAVLSETGAAPHRLAIEITEGLQIEGQPDVIRSIGELRLLGVKIWLDDFGTGFAGLSCVREIAFDVIKIDRSFLQTTAMPKGAQMFRNIVNLVRNAGCQTLVEGIETQEQLDLCSERQVDFLQGYHLGAPMSADALGSLMERERASHQNDVRATA